MQGKKEMIDDILQTAKKSAAAMISEAEEELRASTEALRTELEKAKLATDADAESAADAAYSGRVKLGELEAGKLMLAAKRDCVEAVYARVREKLLTIPDADYLALMKRLVEAVCSDGDEIVAGKNDKRITADWVKQVGKSAKKSLTLSKARGDFEAGVIVRNAKFDIDLTVDELVADLKDRTVADTAQKLGL